MKASILRTRYFHRTAFLFVLLFAVRTSGFGSSLVSYILGGGFTDSITVNGPVSLEDEESHDFGHSNFAEHVKLHAEVGDLHVFAITVINGITTMNPDLTPARAGASGGALGVALWEDTITLHMPDKAPGALVDVHGFLIFDANISATASFSPHTGNETFGSGAASGVTARFTGSGINIGVFETRSSIPGQNSGLIPGVIPVTDHAFNEVPVHISYRLEVDTAAGGSTGDTVGDTITASAIGDVGQTLDWGGISSVTDPVTGDPITNWSITSDSGFDYTRAFATPEPATWILSVQGLLLCIAMLRRRITVRPHPITETFQHNPRLQLTPIAATAVRRR